MSSNNNGNNKSFAIVPFLFFLLSPFIAMPVTFIGVYNKSKGSRVLVAMFMGFLSYLLLPHISLDISRYYEHYDDISHMSLKEFLGFLTDTSDYVFYWIFFIFSRFGIKFQWVLFFLTTFNYYVVFYIYQEFISKLKLYLSKSTQFKYFVLLFISLGLLSYLSATRFTLATSFFLLFLYLVYIQKSLGKGIIMLVLSIFTHIGIAIYLPLITLVYVLRNASKKVIVRFVFFAVLVFSFVPITLLILPLKPFVPGLVSKIEIYVEFEEKAGNFVSVISHMLVIFCSLFTLLIFNKYMNKGVFTSLLVTVMCVGITLPFGHVVYDRYILVLKPILVLVLLYLYSHRSIMSRIEDIRLFLIIRLTWVGMFLYVVYSLYFYRESIRPYYNF